VARTVLDSSAVLAVLNLEKGADVVLDHLREAVISAINLTEVATKLVDQGQSVTEARHTIALLGMDVETVDERQSYAAASLRPGTKSKGLSTGDRHCIALGQKMGASVVTGDKSWKQVDSGVDIILFR
jgi:ribonuclease VapC